MPGRKHNIPSHWTTQLQESSIVHYPISHIHHIWEYSTDSDGILTVSSFIQQIHRVLQLSFAVVLQEHLKYRSMLPRLREINLETSGIFMSMFPLLFVCLQHNPNKYFWGNSPLGHSIWTCIWRLLNSDACPQNSYIESSIKNEIWNPSSSHNTPVLSHDSKT